MRPKEVCRHAGKKLAHFLDNLGSPKFPRLDLSPVAGFPQLPDLKTVPVALRDALARDAADILAGRWKAFGWLPIQVGDPPEWHWDHLARVDRRLKAPGSKCDHRAQPGGADIKLVWEPNRWFQLVRLAQAAWILQHPGAAEKCLAWLSDWVRENPPYQGLNWTSGLETGMRLVQFCWIDALLSASGVDEGRLLPLRQAILPPHIHYTWRFRSFGSSANNHLLGELAGVILALCRWPALEAISTPLPAAQSLWEGETLLQFAPDGGNKEQALGYHLYSWEFCWQTMAALSQSGRTPSQPVVDRIHRAADFYADLKPPGDPWDYGDSDNAYVTPFFADEQSAAEEWRRWFVDPESSPAIHWWWSRHRIPESDAPVDGWKVFSESGHVLGRFGDWFVRWDASPLGYLSMAPHGHCDALHLSIWHKGDPVVIDPGTGAYYADKPLREHLAGWSSHNGPRFDPLTPRFPERFGTFLWGSPHNTPGIQILSQAAVVVSLEWPNGVLQRKLEYWAEKDAWIVEDKFSPRSAANVDAMASDWKFSPAAQVRRMTEGHYSIQTPNACLLFKIEEGWRATRLQVPNRGPGVLGWTMSGIGDPPIEMVCSPAFRALALCPAMRLDAPDGQRVARLVLAAKL